jgi:hypothetical protein
MLPTPKGRDWKGKSQRGNYGNTTDCLPNAIETLPTPQARDYRGYARVNSTSTYYMLNEEVGKRTGLKLHSDFVSWMMGFPLDWLDV